MARLNYEVAEFFRPTKLFELVDEFVNSGADIAEFVFAEGEYKSAGSAVTSLLSSISKRHITNVGVKTKKGKVFLVRKESK